MRFCGGGWPSVGEEMWPWDRRRDGVLEGHVPAGVLVTREGADWEVEVRRGRFHWLAFLGAWMGYTFFFPLIGGMLGGGILWVVLFFSAPVIAALSCRHWGKTILRKCGERIEVERRIGRLADTAEFEWRTVVGCQRYQHRNQKFCGLLFDDGMKFVFGPGLREEQKDYLIEFVQAEVAKRNG